MTQLFSEAEKEQAFKTKKTLWIIFGVISGVMVAVSTVIFIFRYQISYGWSMAINITILTLYLWFCLFFFSIKYKLTRNFCRMLKGFDKGLREERRGLFICFDDTKSVKDGVDCYNMKTSEQYDKRGVLSERMILIERTREKPDFKEGDRLHYFTHANILVEYEVVGDLKTVKAVPAAEPQANEQ